MAVCGEKTCYLTDSINEGADGPFGFMDVPDYSYMLFLILLLPAIAITQPSHKQPKTNDE
jgi:hypothetical protein